MWSCTNPPHSSLDNEVSQPLLSGLTPLQYCVYILSAFLYSLCSSPPTRPVLRNNCRNPYPCAKNPYPWETGPYPLRIRVKVHSNYPRFTCGMPQMGRRGSVTESELRKDTQPRGLWEYDPVGRGDMDYYVSVFWTGGCGPMGSTSIRIRSWRKKNPSTLLPSLAVNLRARRRPLPPNASAYPRACPSSAYMRHWSLWLPCFCALVLFAQ